MTLLSWVLSNSYNNKLAREYKA